MATLKNVTCFLIIGLIIGAFLGPQSGCSRESPAPDPPVREIATEPMDATQDPSNRLVFVADIWPPYNCALEDSNEGFIVEVAREIFEPLGYAVEYRVVPWKRALAGTRDGIYDGAIAASKIEEPNLIFPREVILQNRAAFFVRADDKWNFTGEESLQQMRLGTSFGYDYVPWLNEYIASNAGQGELVQVIHGNDPQVQNLKKLLHDHIDLMVGNRGTIHYKALQMGIGDQIRFAGEDPLESPCYLAFSPAHARGKVLAQQFDDGLQRLRTSGRLNELGAYYQLADIIPFGER